MTLTLDQWHKRFQQQAQWTQSIRQYAYNQADIKNRKVVLDIGCGTGVILQELQYLNGLCLIGLDIDISSLQLTKTLLDRSMLICGDAMQLPFQSKSADICFCHFLLLWLTYPLQALQEMVRVTRPGGFIMALAEPDYGGRIDFPYELEKVGTWQAEALIRQGANPYIGRELRSMFSRSGLIDIEVGLIGGQWKDRDSDENIDLEWRVIRSDLAGNQQFIDEYEELIKIDFESRRDSSRILFVPTFYAIGKVRD